MAKSRKKTFVAIINELDIAAKKTMAAEIEGGRSISVVQGEIKDGVCNYTYDVILGRDKGFNHKVKGIGLVEDDMRTAISKLNVHLAVIDDIFKHSDIQFEDIDKMHAEELALLYEVSGFKIQGGEDNESIIIIGTKYLSAGSRMKLESPKIPMDNLSSYKWYNELKAVSDVLRNEIKLYHYGKYTAVEIEDEDNADEKQTKITFELGGADNGEEHTESDDDFEKAKI